MTELGRLQIKRKTGTEQFRANGIEIGTDLLDFCRWSASDLVNNTMRGVLAEYSSRGRLASTRAVFARSVVNVHGQ
jgi:hypothetical protein